MHCASIHGRFYLEAGGEKGLIESLFGAESDVTQSGILAIKAPTGASPEQVLLHTTAALTRTPERFNVDALQALSDAGFSAAHSLDILLTSALFAWSNRLIQTLGDTTEQR